MTTTAPPQEEKKATYVEKPDYGKVPEYLESVKQQCKEEEQVITKMMEGEKEIARRMEPKVKLLPEAERLEVCISICYVI